MQENNSNIAESDNSIQLEGQKSESEHSGQPDRSQNIGSKKRIHRRQEISNFIMKTYKILEDRKNSHIIEWTEGGTCFIVKNKDLFQNQILPKYFKHKKFSSFVRQLNMYDFHKIRKQKQIPIFKHKFFKMGCYELLHKIKRKSGEDPKDEDPSRAVISYPDLPLNPDQPMPKSAISFRSKGTQSLGDQIDELIRQNNQLRNSIAEIEKESSQVELQKSKKQEKMIKLLSAIVYFDMRQSVDNVEEQCSLRQLQHHFSSEEEPFSYLEYSRKLNFIYRSIYESVFE